MPFKFNYTKIPISGKRIIEASTSSILLQGNNNGKHNYNIHEGQQKGSTYTDERQEAPDDVTSNFIEIIEQLIKMDGLTIEICGSFIWCGGNTRAHKEQLKAMGFRWASRKKLWFLAPDGWKKQGREWSMDRIRDRHGSEVIRGQEPRRRKPYKAIA